jgi:hypothetical protein
VIPTGEGHELVAMIAYRDFMLSSLGKGMLEMLASLRILKHLFHSFGDFNPHLVSTILLAIIAWRSIPTRYGLGERGGDHALDHQS